MLKAAREADVEAPVIVMTAFGTIEEAVRAMKEGAADFLTKPVDTEHLLVLLDRAVERRRLATEYVLLKEDYQRRYGLPRVLGDDPAWKETMLAVQRAAPAEATVLLLGESGTGKELLSRALHQLSPRAKGPFVAINCAAIPEALLENELFGHEKGAFTGAAARKIGKAELAHRGTLFLDEIGDLPLALQAKILRLVQERQFERVGGLQTISVDVRVVAATNRDLREAVARREFREDLLLPPVGLPARDPAAAPAAQRHPRCWPTPSSSATRGRWAGAGCASRKRRAAALLDHSLARQRARAPELDRARGHPRRRKRDRAVATCAWPRRRPPVRGWATCSISRVRSRKSGRRAAARAEDEAIRLALQECRDDRNEAAARLGISAAALARRLRGPA